MRKRGGRAKPRRGEVWLVNFDPTIGSEIQKTRPAVVLQNDIGNRFSSVTIVAAISSQFGDTLYPTEVLVEPPDGGLKTRSVVLLNQVRTVDGARLVKKMGALRPATLEAVNSALAISLGLTDIS
ncbi:PemK family transcriptional regulator [Candidatus Kaiserbacteria bacterium RIFCSPHIGHO2_02_FULL_59_21]|uniref:mRNA interferase n=1 Tax=Candidatus Kaiserbacteria bacterium RIFCSPHIGHO2_02_FULL_59_21 TaxID=1798500 RepID=A0A1F6E1Q1_9BACT|nr:MAG: PemK family transcriptional regulator [Candidatus Kaiserbacteria bacterium RIFCSPHIGHO2_01_FULL_58_22]OGG67593.1 MAG: PemK family transcriptional regulator [Candidatus Kaiserbacteria bacterium RIFCSPHIGHO2_02_FULL_59_21]OGG80663.1 MAG: PemK family transcriptional regulator [Candidatus Kaiserbacteria bacterium RIFCSPLOWO2_01_FULL_59_34]OGG85446.1 MAG: PemK family transcriptional regulator [Candidatus Kaiserbacteria bacterium RIFCSPLOWO2_02_FULL_59_19]